MSVTGLSGSRLLHGTRDRGRWTALIHAAAYRRKATTAQWYDMTTRNTFYGTCISSMLLHSIHRFRNNYLTCNFSDLYTGGFKVIQRQRSWYQSKAHWWFPIWPPLYPTSYLASHYSRYLMPKSCDLELGRFKVIEGQRSWCQSISRGWFPIRLPLTPSSYLSPFSRYLTLKIFLHMRNGED